MEFEIPPDLLAEVDDKLFSPDERLLIKTPADLPLKWRQEGVMKEEFDRYIRNEPSPLVFPHFGIINDVPRAIQKRVDDPESTSTNIDIEREVYSILEEVCRSTIAKKISNIKSAAEEVRLESGTNAVHLALGAVSWEEATSSRGGKKVTQWEAPLFLYPVIISGSKSAGFSIRLDQTGAITPNYCLREKLRREPYNIDLPELEYPEADESGIDLEAMMGSIEAKLSEQKLTNFSVVLSPTVMRYESSSRYSRTCSLSAISSGSKTPRGFLNESRFESGNFKSISSELYFLEQVYQLLQLVLLPSLLLILLLGYCIELQCSLH